MHAVTVVTQIATPYQAELFDALHEHGRVNLKVIYLADARAFREWRQGELDHPHVVMEHADAKGRKTAEEWIAQADLTVFGNYSHRDAHRWIRTRNRARRPWCFWGERPGFRGGGLAGRMYRAWKLYPLLVSGAPIWGIGNWAVEGYRREFGVNRRYYNVAYFSDLERFRTERVAESGQGGAGRILFSGSLTKRKGVDLLAAAFRDIAIANGKVTLEIVGSGNLREAMQRILAPVIGRVTFHGFKQWEDLPSIYAAADILCVPSRYDGWGLVVPEGLAAGLPVIATDRMGAARDLLRDGSNGWIAKAGDLASLRNALGRAVEMSGDEVARMRKHALESVAGHSLSDGVLRFEEAVAGSLD